MTGTLEGITKPVFIKRIRLDVCRISDGAKHSFFWRAFRPNTVVFGDAEPQKFELAGSFLLTPDNPYQYNIFFVDENFLTLMNPKVAPFIAAWNHFREQRIKEIQESQTTLNLARLLQDSSLTEMLYEEFCKTDDHVSAYTLLDRNCYWTEGDYSLDIVIEASRPKVDFTKSYTFAISEEQSNGLRINTLRTLRAICGIPVYYEFAYASYKTE